MDGYDLLLFCVLVLFSAGIGYFLAVRYIAWMQGIKKKHKSAVYLLGAFGAATSSATDSEFFSELRKKHPALYNALFIVAVAGFVIGLVLGYWKAWAVLLILAVAVLYVLFWFPKKQARKRQ